ncbi:hypothetical protein BCR44DRAFT_1483283 [Catenaria anguillulae PL171]|uniref:Ankyrin repeat-containing domain protein n=1 Tax=Catenaria anguillulae PL171 TaxID=765915 RepID=A0A1Y2HZA5_9FUNG|nr:hypothetical protein BCR44DRAFT_1483283 [Catenaria anguillulae PL171]
MEIPMQSPAPSIEIPALALWLPAAARWALEYAPKPPMDHVTAQSLDKVVAVALRAGNIQVYSTCCGNVNVQVLDWLVDHNATCLDVDADPVWIDSANTGGHHGVLEWWNQSKLPFKFNEMALWDAVKNKHEKVIRWWIWLGKVKGKIILSPFPSLLFKSIMILVMYVFTCLNRRRTRLMLNHSEVGQDGRLGKSR